ncbi:MAG: cupredoxin domain-containing protein [Candidatus Rokuibacteriota bacterium]
MKYPGRDGRTGMSRTQALASLVFPLALAGCASAPVARAAQRGPTGGQAMTIEMSGFNFIPNVIILQAGVPVTITAVSRSRIPHNITILALDGREVKSVNIKARETVTFDATVPVAGRYVFYCDVFLHRWPFGMEGTLVAK